MDLFKTGKFIQERRKLKKLTQLELAERLNISEKTVSKWECGKGFPDTSLILPLCEELEINANELLSGKVLSNEEEYKQKAEENILDLKKQQITNTKNLFLLENVLGIMSLIVFLVMVFCAIFGEVTFVAKIVMLVTGSIIFLIGTLFALFIEQKAGYYECSNCGYKYVPKYLSVFFAIHNGRTRLLKCPKCKKYTMNKKVIDNE